MCYASIPVAANIRIASENDWNINRMRPKESEEYWRSEVPLETLKARAQLLRTIRNFFESVQVLEVETPILASRTVTDVHIDSFEVTPFDYERSLQREGYLQTSPEYLMKRLLAGGSGSIYQISKAFRRDEPSRLHNPEFTLLEWYRVDFTLDALMDEVESLVKLVLPEKKYPIARVSYASLFQKYLGIDPHTITLESLRAETCKKIDLGSEDLAREDYTQLLFAKCIDPNIDGLCFIFDYPKDQAALAEIVNDAEGRSVANRFELLYGDLELANGYSELRDPAEQLRRFTEDLKGRSVRGLKKLIPDERLISALESGLPACSGVALGVDRLLMAKLGEDSIDRVITFTTPEA